VADELLVAFEFTNKLLFETTVELDPLEAVATPALVEDAVDEAVELLSAVATAVAFEATVEVAVDPPLIGAPEFNNWAAVGGGVVVPFVDELLT